MVPGNVTPKGQFEEMVGEGSKEQWKGMGKEGFGRRKQPGKVRGSSFVRPWWSYTKYACSARVSERSSAADTGGESRW